MQINFKSWIQIGFIQFLLPILGFQKHLALVYLFKTVWCYTFWKPKMRRRKKLKSSKTYLILSAKSLTVTGRTLHTARCTLHTAPEPPPASAPVHFILHIEHWTLHTTYLYCMLYIYHFTLQTFKSWLSWDSRWWRQNYHWFKARTKKNIYSWLGNQEGF